MLQAVYVGNLPASATDAKLKELFDTFAASEVGSSLHHSPRHLEREAYALRRNHGNGPVAMTLSCMQGRNVTRWCMS